MHISEDIIAHKNLTSYFHMLKSNGKMQDFNGNHHSSFMGELLNLSYFYAKRRFELYIFDFLLFLDINKSLKCKNK